jgi:hypothetical protein
MARLLATVLLPTPPLPEAMAMIFLTPGMLDLGSLSALPVAALGGSLMSKFRRGSVTPGILLRTSMACSWMRRGILGSRVAMLISTVTLPPSTAMLLTRPKEMMSRLKPG